MKMRRRQNEQEVQEAHRDADGEPHRTQVGRRQVLTGSARLVAASAAATLLLLPGTVTAAATAATAATAAAAAATAAAADGETAASRAGAGSRDARGSTMSTTSPETPRLRHLNPPTLATPRGYTHVVDVTGGRTIYVSGQVAIDRAGEIVGANDVRAQTQQVFQNLKAALDAAGAGFADVVKLGIYMLDASQVQVVRDVRDTFVDVKAPPASTLVEVRRLARPEFLIEIEAIANVR
jgi:enamine deaminase RidA (YjgF/YER057c/UK114 family)